MAADSRIDDYLASLPADQRQALERLRTQIRRIVPEATETISYGMPAFRLNGRFFVSFAGWKAHCSLYPLTDTFLVSHDAELDGFKRTKGSVHFTPARPLPDDVLEELLLARRADLEGGRGD